MASDALNVLIAGGGVAAAEAALALHALAGERVRLTLVSPGREIALVPATVAEPFGAGHAERIPMADLTGSVGAEHVDGLLERVRPADRRAVLAGGAELGYEVLVVAVGARPFPAFGHAHTFLAGPDPGLLAGLVADLEEGYARSVAFLVPPGVSWTLPAYELALLTAGEVFSMGVDDAQLTLVTPEARPVALFGPRAGEAVGAILDDAGVAVELDAYAEIRRAGRIELRPGDRELAVDRIVALPLWEGPRLPGLPRGPDGFIAVDEHGAVRGVADVFAAGDGTDFPIKQGGLACQQADAAAAAIAARAGAPITPEPFRPVLRGRLLTGSVGAFLQNAVAGGGGEGVISQDPLWWPPTKIAGRYLGPWLAARAPQAEPDPASVEVEVELPGDRGWAAAMALDPQLRPDEPGRAR